MMPHLHFYKLVEDTGDYDWGGLRVRKRVWHCRFCKAKKTTMSGVVNR